MPSPLSLAVYRSRTTIPTSLVDRCAAQGKDVQAWLDMKWSHIKSKLVKRYAVANDFQGGDVPGKIVEWLILLVDINVWQCVGGMPEGREDGWADKDRDRAEKELDEAADAEKGKFELPLKDSDALGASAVNKGGPHVVIFVSAFDYFDAVRDVSIT